MTRDEGGKSDLRCALASPREHRLNYGGGGGGLVAATAARQDGSVAVVVRVAGVGGTESGYPDIQHPKNNRAEQYGTDPLPGPISKISCNHQHKFKNQNSPIPNATKSVKE